MAYDFTGRTVMITGATRGIGRATAEAFAAAGARLILLGRSAKALRQTADALGAAAPPVTVLCDMRDRARIPAAAAEALAAAGRIDVLINNAGISGDASPFLEIREAEWDTMLAVNLTGTFLLAQAVARAMAGAGGGVILHTASIAALGADGAYAHYSVAKAGLLALTRSMGVELAPHAIRVNSVSPGYTRTDMTTQCLGPDAEPFLSSGFVRAPIRRLVEAREIADAFLFLASEAASGITGTNLVVDGGLTANLYVMETFPNAS
jgi:NAD(P)-dependent dehydrogenase (short-subunit alcohol dehydrogenase family)